MKQNRNTKAKILARRLAITNTLIAYSFIAFIMFLLFWSINRTLKDLFTVFSSEFLYPLLSFFIIGFIVTYFVSKSSCMDLAIKLIEKENSKTLTESCFVPGVPRKIILISTQNNNYKDYILGLSDICEFYAVLGEDNLISIYSKFHVDGKERHFDVITKEEFTTYCELAD